LNGCVDNLGAWAEWLFPFVVLVIWLLRGVLRVFRLDKKKQPGSGEIPGGPRSAEGADRSSGAPVLKPAVQSASGEPIDGAKESPSASRRARKKRKKRKTKSGLQPQWKALTDRLVRLEEDAYKLARESGKSRYAKRLEAWIQRYVAKRARKVLSGLAESGALERSRLTKAESHAARIELRLDAFRRAVGARSQHNKKQAERLTLGDRVFDTLFDPLLGPKLANGVKTEGILAALPSMDEQTRAVFADMGIMVIDIPVGWPEAIETWPAGFHSAVRDLLIGRPGLLQEGFRKTGLSGTWTVAYSQPVYVSPNEILGPFGPWLATLLADLVSVLMFGPAWAEAYVRVMTARLERTQAKRTPTSSNGWHLGDRPAACLRAEVLARLLETLDYKKAAGRVRKVWENRLGECASLLMPTRRGTYYEIGAEPYLEAGHGLMAFLLEQVWDRLGDLRLDEIEGLDPAHVSATRLEPLVVAALAGRPARASMRQRMGAALRAWVRDPEGAERIRRAVLAGLIPRERQKGRQGAPRAVSLGGLDFGPRAIVESVMLGVLLGKDERASSHRPRRGRAARRRLPLPTELMRHK
jgi:hypothetical protein